MDRYFYSAVIKLNTPGFSKPIYGFFYHWFLCYYAGWLSAGFDGYTCSKVLPEPGLREDLIATSYRLFFVNDVS